jgi:hypothetical protein
VLVQRRHVTQRAFLRHEVQRREAIAGIVDEHDEATARPPLLEPGVVTAVDLDELTEARAALAQEMQPGLGTAMGAPELGLEHQLAHRFLRQVMP